LSTNSRKDKVHGNYEGIETESLSQVEMNKTNGCEKNFGMDILVAMKDLSGLQLHFLACGGTRLLVHYFIPIQKTIIFYTKKCKPRLANG
jgi:hypothetical protein